MAYQINNTTVIGDAETIESAQSNIVVENSLTLASIIYSPVQGSTSGYNSGGGLVPIVNTIDKFPFAVDANSTDVGDLTVARRFTAGQSSSESGYTSGGIGSIPSSVGVNTIDKFPFASNGNATDVGDLTQGRYKVAGQSSTTSGYSSGGAAAQPVFTGMRNIIDKFPFATNANATDVGDLTRVVTRTAGQSSIESGYISGGIEVSNDPATPLAFVNNIEKFPFATNANATDVGDLTQGRAGGAGQSSSVSGYTSGGYSPNVNTIDKFPFASDANATDVGDLTEAGNRVGQSSQTSGYSSTGPSGITIDKFPFATDANATDVGDLTQARNGGAGQQV